MDENTIEQTGSYLTPQGVCDILRGMILSEITRKRPLAAFDYCKPLSLDSGDSYRDFPGIDEMDTVLSNAARMFGMNERVFKEKCREFVDPHLPAEYILRERDKEYVFFSSSGSTGKPKIISCEYRLLAQEISVLASLFADRLRIVAVVPAQHIYGFLFSVLLPVRLGVEIIRLPHVIGNEIVPILRKGDMIVAFPMFWKSVAAAGVEYPEGVRGVTSTGPCAQETEIILLNKGLERLYEIYGSSETGGIGWRPALTEHFALFPYWQFVQATPEGKIFLKRSLPGGGETKYEIPDHIQRFGDAAFLPTGRRDMAVQVAGVNVYPLGVENLIKTRPDVRECSVRLMRQDEGDRLKAYIVLQDGRTPSADEIREFRAWLSRQLTPPEIPRQLTFGTELPCNSLGKTTDW